MQGLAWGMAAVMLAAAVRTTAGAEPAAPKPSAPVAPAQEDLRVLPPGAGDNLLREYLLRECGKAFDARRRAVADLKSADDILKRQERLRADWAAALGEFPERTPLNAETVATLDRDGCRIEKVLYESRPKHHVTANLYLPKDAQPPLPGVLVPCGHDKTGKACEAYQSLCLSLVRHGFAVLCYDPIGQGERIQTFDADGKMPVWGTKEHTLVDIGARLVGLGAAHYRVWDGLRSLDYLAGRPEVDPKRLGCTGNSGGGTLTAYLMATDERIWAAAPSCYITSLERLFATIGPQDGEQNIPAQVALGIEHADYALMRAPRPTLLLTATRDYFDIDGAWATFREAKGLFSRLGHGERIDLFEYPDSHGYTKPRREAALRWMRRWLQDRHDEAAEPPLALNTEADLRVTAGGQVVPERRGDTTWDFNRRRAEALRPGRDAFWRDRPRAEALAEVRRLAAVRAPGGPPAARTVGTVDRDGCRIEKLLIERPDEVPVPALLFLPQPCEGRRPAVLYVDGRGKAADAAPGGAIETLVRSGHVVLSLDVRGVGETAAVKPPKYGDPDYSIPYLALHLGRPLLGQRVEDALAALEVLLARPEADAAKTGIVGVERGGPVALHAAALDERLAEATVRQAIESWTDVVRTPLGNQQLNQIVPGALARYDLPDLVRAIAPRPVRIHDAVDPAGKPRQPAADGPVPAAERTAP